MAYTKQKQNFWKDTIKPSENYEYVKNNLE
jgi:hypothetical protein